jgi:hypothetical protein
MAILKGTLLEGAFSSNNESIPKAGVSTIFTERRIKFLLQNSAIHSRLHSATLCVRFVNRLRASAVVDP